MEEKTRYAQMWWSTEDVLELRPKWTEEQADEFLSNNQNRLRDRLIELGWEVINDLMEYEEYEEN
jgi:hypothetical protein